MRGLWARPGPDPLARKGSVAHPQEQDYASRANSGPQPRLASHKQERDSLPLWDCHLRMGPTPVLSPTPQAGGWAISGPTKGTELTN